jgi:hypothetical protein
MKLWRHPITIVLLASAVSMTGIALGQETAPNAMVDAAYIRTVSTDNPLGMPSVNTSSEPAKSEAKLGPVLPENIRLVGSTFPSDALTE